MFNIQENDIQIIPLNYVLAQKNYHNDDSYFKKFRTDSKITRNDIAEVGNHIKNNPYNYIAVDMQHISEYSSRSFIGFNHYNVEKVFFYNIREYTDIINNMKIDLNSDCYIIKEQSIVCFSKTTEDYLHSININEVLDKIIIKKIKQIVSSVIIDKENYLDSSSVFSNKYINLKNLFVNPEDTQFIIYKLSELAAKNMNEYDYLISASKTGAVIANLVGQMINKDVFYCSGIGPRFAVHLNEIGYSIPPNKKFMFIYDFLCLGTEHKLLNYIIKSCKSDLVGSVGVASLIDLEIIKEMDKHSILAKSKCLINILNEGIDYKIYARPYDNIM